MHPQPRTLGLIGSGHIGSTVARLAVAAGYQVVLSNSRGPATLADLVAELGPSARAATPVEAAEAGDLVVVTVPLRAYPQVPVDPLRGKIVIDTNNYYPERDGRFEALDNGSDTVSGLLQKHLPQSTVVKAFNNIYYKHLQALARAAGSADRSALPIAGDSAEGKAAVTAFLDSLGYDTVDGGTLADSWRFERDMPAYGVIYFGPPPAGGAGIPDGTPTPAAKIRDALAQARR